jgi:hypothetical protein
LTWTPRFVTPTKIEVGEFTKLPKYIFLGD